MLDRPDREPRGARRIDAGQRVFDHDDVRSTQRWIGRAQPAEREQIALGIGLAAQDVLGGHDVRDRRSNVESAQSQLDFSAQRARHHHHQTRVRRGAHSLGGAVEQAELRARTTLVLDGLLSDERVDERVGVRDACVGEHRRERASVVEAEVALVVLRLAHRRNSSGDEHVVEALVVQVLVIHEHAVEIEEGRD